jgi:putative redox protein
MSTQMEFAVQLVNEKVKFTGSLRGLEPITVDYMPPIGNGEGYTSLELFLMSMSTCAGTSVISLLRRLGKKVDALKITSIGTRKEEHPTCFSKIILIFDLESPDTEIKDMEKAIQISEEKFCPVWAMIKNNVEVVPEIRITKR